MKILATDFDGTFSTGGDSIPRNIQAVRQWQAAGNRFGIVTGRPYPMLRPELERYHIPADFLVCVNGASIHRPNGELLWSSALPEPLFQEILSLPEFEEMPVYLVANGQGMAICIREHTDPFWEKFWPEICNLGCLSPQGIRGLTGITQMSTISANAQEAHAFAQKLTQQYRGQTASHVNRNYVDTTAAGSDKAQGLFRLAALEGWEPEWIHTMWDGCNDLPMLCAFSSAAPTRSEPQVLAAIPQTYDSVADYIHALL